MKRLLFSSMLLSLGVLLSSAQAQNKEYQDDAIYIRFKQTTAPKLESNTQFVSIEKAKAIGSRQEAYGLHREMLSMRTLGNPVLERTFKIRLDSIGKIEQLVEELQKEDQIELVERIPVYYLQGSVIEQPESPKTETAPNDPFYESGNISSTSSWHLAMIHAEEAWNVQSGSDKIKVAVVDNAIWGDHPDLQISSENQHNIASGTTGNSAPPSSVSQTSECADANNCVPLNWSHGTHCAGAVGAIRNNGVGIASIGSGVTLMGVSCPGTDASGLAVRDAFQGVSWAASHGAKVISLSWGNYNINETDRAIIQACIDQNIIVVAAAGNDGYKDSPLYPANLPGVISVASVDNNKQISSFSNYGDWVSIASPGGKIIQNGQETRGCIFSTTYSVSQRYRLANYSFANGQYYDGMFGTSMATPIVSGLCGLLLSADSTLTPYLMREILVNATQPIAATAGRNIAPNSGIIDAAAAIRLKGINIARVKNLTAERQNLDMILKWEKPESDNEVSFYQIFNNNVFVGQVSGEEFSFTEKISTEEKLYHFGVRALYANGDTSLRNVLDVRVPKLYSVDVTVQPEGCGSITGAGVHPAGDIRIVAKVADGCTFTRWMENNKVIGRDTVLDYTVESNTEIRAVFSGNPSANSTFNRTLPMSIYPNPTSGKFVVEVEGTGNTVEIFSMDGSLVATYKGLDEKTELTLKENGTYVVRVSNKAGSATGKIVVR